MIVTEDLTRRFKIYGIGDGLDGSRMLTGEGPWQLVH